VCHDVVISARQASKDRRYRPLTAARTGLGTATGRRNWAPQTKNAGADPGVELMKL